MMERFSVLDESGTVIGCASRDECHSGTFLLHGVVHLLAFNDSGELLLQKRSTTKDIQPGKWDTSVGGHINEGETVAEALAREMAEELGITGVSCQKLYTYIHESDIEREFVTTFRCVWNEPVVFPHEEIDEVGWFSFERIASLVGTGELTPNFEQEWEDYQRWCRKHGGC
ncbi:NUDIX domain-containing protein [Candidatus Latescibacterota bacterium]